MPDLSALTPAERETLTLLARGNTAKSIANLTGRSVGSVNERLREARRKTGVGSSRELARLLAAQENRNELIGVAGATRTGAGSVPEATARSAGGLVGKVFLTMALILAGGAAALALVLQPAAQDVPAPDPQMEELVGSADMTPSALYRKLRAETRDDSWAPAAEATLHARYAAVPRIAHGDALQVRCGATLCEIAGTIAVRDNATINATMQALQDPQIEKQLRAQGFGKALSQSFGGGKGPPRFLIYWSRAGG